MVLPQIGILILFGLPPSSGTPLRHSPQVLRLRGSTPQVHTSLSNNAGSSACPGEIVAKPRGARREGAPSASRAARASKTAEDGLRMAQDGVQTAQQGSKTASRQPKSPQEVPRALQKDSWQGLPEQKLKVSMFLNDFRIFAFPRLRTSKTGQEAPQPGPRGPQEGPKERQSGSNTARVAPKTAQEAAQMAPRQPLGGP